MHVFIRRYLFLYVFVFTVFPANANNPHQPGDKLNSQDSQCMNCHIEKPDANGFVNGKNLNISGRRFKHGGLVMCESCHGGEAASHIVGVTPEYTVPADLPLEKGSVTCLTCHYVHGDLKSERAMASSSLMDHIFNRERLSKSFVLRRNNSDGELCLACHEQ